MGYMRFFAKHTDNFVLPLLYSILIDIFSSPSEPISPYLGCCGGFAVDDHSFTRRAYHLWQTRLVNNPGYLDNSGNIDIFYELFKFNGELKYRVISR